MSILKKFSTEGLNVNGNLFSVDTNINGNSASLQANSLLVYANSVFIGNTIFANSTQTNIPANTVISANGTTGSNGMILYTTGSSSYYNYIDLPAYYNPIANVTIPANTVSSGNNYTTVFTNIPSNYRDIVIEFDKMWTWNKALIDYVNQGWQQVAYGGYGVKVGVSNDNGQTFFPTNDTYATNSNSPIYYYTDYYTRYYSGTIEIGGYSTFRNKTSYVNILNGTDANTLSRTNSINNTGNKVFYPFANNSPINAIRVSIFFGDVWYGNNDTPWYTGGGYGQCSGKINVWCR